MTIVFVELRHCFNQDCTQFSSQYESVDGGLRYSNANSVVCPRFITEKWKAKRIKTLVPQILVSVDMYTLSRKKKWRAHILDNVMVHFYVFSRASVTGLLQRFRAP